MADSATIVAASLDSSQLEQSINKLVSTVAEKTKAMADNFTSEVARMEQAVKNLGNIKIDSGGTADGGSSRRTKMLSEESLKAKEVAMTYDQMQAAFQRIAKDNSGLKDIRTFNKEELQSYIDLLRKLQAEYVRVNTQEGGGAKSDQIKRDMAELEKIIQGYQTILKNVEMINSRQGTIDVKKWTQDIGAVDDRYKKLVRWYTVLEKEDQRRIANEEKANQKRLAELDKEEKARQKMIESARKAEEKYQNAVLKTAFNKIVDLPSNNIDQMRTKLERLQTILANIRELGILSPKDISNAETEIGKLRGNIQQIEKIEKERIAAERQFIIEQQKEIENLTTIEGRVKSLSQATKQYFAENKGEYWRTFNAYGKDFTIYNPEKSNRANGLSIEEQITNILKEEKAAREGASQAAQQQANSTQNVAKAQQEESTAIRKNFRDYDTLRQAIASVIGVKTEDVRLYGVEISSINQLSDKLKQLRSVYNQLGTQDRHSERGKELISQIQNIERQMDRARKELSRPIDLKSALSTSEKTLDDIAYKMQRLSSYRSGLNVETQKKEINTVNQEYDRLKKKMDEVMQKNQSMIASNNALGRSWNYMKNRLAFYFSVGASTQFIKNLIEVRSQYEMNERALGILINSAERGTQIFNELSQMALVSPYTLIELSAAAKQLTAYDVAARDVVDTTRRLADMAAAVGIPIERLTYALGQIKAYGYLNSRDARMFANAGIPLVKQLSDYYTELEGRLVSTADVYDRIKKKSIDYNEVMEVMYKMTDQGGKFFDFQAKMADTLKVRLANLTLAWNNMLNDMGKDTQGVLTWGIGALRDMFNQWRVLGRAIKDVAWIVGIRTGIALASYSIQKFIALLRGTQSQMALSEVFGKRLANVIRTLGRAMLSLAKNPLTWVGVVAIGLYQMEQAIWGANEAQIALNKSIRDGAKDNYDNITKFLDQYKQVRESLYTTQKVAIGNMYDPATGKASATAYVEQSVEQDINKNEAKKAWEAIREQIELTTRSSDQYIGRLLEISNMSERVRQGFNILEDIRVVNAALKDLDEDTIKVEKDMSAWWNAYQMPGGLIGNIKDYQKELDDIIKKYGSLESLLNNVHVGGDNWGDFSDYQTALERLQSSIKTTTDSIINFIELKGWSGDINKINEVFKQIADKIALDNQLDPQKAFVLQTQVEEARSQAAKQVLLQRINDEKAALAQASDENQRKAIIDSINANVAEYNNWNDFNGRKKVEWERFTKWLKEQHISETTAMFRNMDAEDIKSLNFQEGKYGEYVTRMVEMYAKEHKMSYDEAFGYLKNWVTNANKWSVFIPMTISTEDKKSVYAQLGEYDNAIDAADAEIERLTRRIDELNSKKEKSKEETQQLKDAEQELADAQKAKADAEAKGGHGKKEKKEERAAQKERKQAESELQKALKDELSIIDKIRNNYQALTKEGMSHADAVKASTDGYKKSAKTINQTLAKFGLQAFDPSAFAGISDPNDLVKLLEDQLNKLISSGKAKPSEIKDLEVKINDVKLDAEKYNLTRITKGLNNELDKLKDEYELAVSLDADPELGSMFADWMGIDMNELPRTAQEYAERASKILNNNLKDLGAKTKLPNVLDITDDDMRAFEENKTFTDKQLELVKKAVEAARGFQRKETEERIKDWDKLLEKYAEYETKINRIQNDAVKERVTFAQQFGSNDEKSMALKLQTQILAATDPQERQRLIQQLQELVKSIAGDDKAKLNIVTAIDNSQDQGIVKANFEEFQKSPEWITATGELSVITNKAINGLIASLEKYKKTAKSLDPKQIKQINNALKNLYKQQRKSNPFGAISDLIDEANERMKTFEPELEATMSKIVALENEIGDNDPTEEQSKRLKTLKDRWKELYEIQQANGKINSKAVVDAVNQTISAVSQATQIFGEFADAIGGKGMTEAKEALMEVTSLAEKTGQGAQIGASFGGYGAIIGAVAGLVTGLVSITSKWDAINVRIESSEKTIKRLELAYIGLKNAIDDAYATTSYGASRAAIAYQTLELQQLKYQLRLEEQRSSKDRDSDRILELQKQIKELENDIKSATDEITADLLGITKVSDAAEQLAASMIDAFKRGEDYMEEYSDSFEKMIDNMIAKAIASKIIGQRIQQMWDYAKSIADERASNTMYDVTTWKGYEKEMTFERAFRYIQAKIEDSIKDEEKDRQAYWEEELRKAQEAYDKIAQPSPEDIRASSEMWQSWKDADKEAFDAWMEAYGIKYGEAAETTDNQLSALQQGIQGITEDTAGALEAYMNGVSQQVYYQSDLLTQIRDAVVGFNLDVQVASMSQILLQLRSSYEMQTAIHSMLEGWSSPNGMSVRVEMV